jgi:hypothetical protein
MRARVRLGEPVVKLQLEVEMVREPAAGLEVRLHVLLQPLDSALRLRLQLRLVALLGMELFV